MIAGPVSTLSILVLLLTEATTDAHFGVLAARAIIAPINTRLTKPEVSYILEHSGAKLILVDDECIHLVKDTKIPVVVTNDSGQPGDPYEELLSAGRRFSKERGWPGLEAEIDENAPAVLCYTLVYRTVTYLLTLIIINLFQFWDNRTGTYFISCIKCRIIILAILQPKGVITTLRGSYLAAIANAYESQYARWLIKCKISYSP
jgi:AMP-binding enzyme